MVNLLGEIRSKLDDKGRLLFPKVFQNQLKDLVKDGFVINRDVFQPCLVIYPMSEWKKTSEQVNSLNRFNQKNAQFIRRFNNGATPVELDAVGRMLIPKALVEYTKADKEIVLLGNGDRIEFWSTAAYDAMLNEEIDFGALSEEVMGGKAEKNE
jgi:MraZ protein